MKEELHHCELCNVQNSIQKIPQLTAILHKDKHGGEVKKGIEDNKKILQEMKKQARSQEYE